MNYGDKEPIYDEKIAPLMSQIIDICKAEKINMVASFQLQSKQETDDEGDHVCTTLLPMNMDHYPEEYKQFCRSIYKKPFVAAITITKRGDR